MGEYVSKDCHKNLKVSEMLFAPDVREGKDLRWPKKRSAGEGRITTKLELEIG